MFSYDEIQKYNETDLRIYKYIISNTEKIQYMTIRELAGELGLSSTTVLRFCAKNDYDSYSDFKAALKEEIRHSHTQPPSEDLQELSAFFSRVNSSAFEEKLSPAVNMIRKSDLIIFIGMGSSGTLAKYGARYFSNAGKFSTGLEDTYYPIETYTYQNAAVIALSESGESRELLTMVQQFQKSSAIF